MKKFDFAVYILSIIINLLLVSGYLFFENFLKFNSIYMTVIIIIVLSVLPFIMYALFKKDRNLIKMIISAICLIVINLLLIYLSVNLFVKLLLNPTGI